MNSTQKTKHYWSLNYLAFVMGVCGMGFEYTFSKLSSDLMGHTVTQWALIIGLMMFAMGLGADFQKRISNQNLWEKFIGFEILLSLLGGFGSLALISVFGSYRDYFTLVQFTVSFSVGFLIGMEIPLLARINEELSGKSIRHNLAQIFKMDYFGGFAGALLWTLVMIRINESIIQIAFILSLTNIASVLFIHLYLQRSLNKEDKDKMAEVTTDKPLDDRKPTSYSSLLTVLLIFSFLINGVGFFSVDDWTPSLEQKLYKDRVVFSKTTDYQHIVITRSKTDILKLYINGNLQFSSFDERIYHEWLVHPAMLLTRSPEKVLVMGGGDGLAVRELQKYSLVRSITLVELDKEVIDLARTQPDLVALNRNSLNQANLKVLTPTLLKPIPGQATFPKRIRHPINEYEEREVLIYNFDAVKFAESIDDSYDLIILDFPDPHGLELSQLYSQSFYQNLKSLLRPGGLIVQQASSPVYVKETFLLIGRTIEKSGLEVLPFQATVPSFGPWGWWLARKPMNTESHDMPTLAERWKELGRLKRPWPITTEYLTPELLLTGRVFSKNALKNEKSGVNTVLNHKAYRYYLEDQKNFWW